MFSNAVKMQKYIACYTSQNNFKGNLIYRKNVENFFYFMGASNKAKFKNRALFKVQFSLNKNSAT